MVCVRPLIGSVAPLTEVTADPSVTNECPVGQGRREERMELRTVAVRTKISVKD